jgi:hypothetical protein
MIPFATASGRTTSIASRTVIGARRDSRRIDRAAGYSG